MQAFQSYSSIQISISFYLFMFGNLYLKNQRTFNLLGKITMHWMSLCHLVDVNLNERKRWNSYVIQLLYTGLLICLLTTRAKGVQTKWMLMFPFLQYLSRPMSSHLIYSIALLHIVMFIVNLNNVRIVFRTWRILHKNVIFWRKVFWFFLTIPTGRSLKHYK